jgi:hypothetical protein
MKNLRKQFTYRNGRIVTAGDIWLNKEALDTLDWWEKAITQANEGDGHKTAWDQFWTKAPTYIASWSDASGLGGFGLIMDGQVMQGHFHREKFMAHESSCAWEILPILAAARLWGPTKLRGKVWLAITDSANNARALNKGVAKGQSYIELMKALQELCVKYRVLTYWGYGHLVQIHNYWTTYLRMSFRELRFNQQGAFTPELQARITALTRQAQDAALEPGMRAVYKARIQAYINFCDGMQKEPSPATDVTLCMYSLWWVSVKKNKESSLPSIFSAIKYYQSCLGLPWLDETALFNVAQTRRGLQKAFPQHRMPKYAITLALIRDMWDIRIDVDNLVQLQILTMCLVGHNGLMRMNEILKLKVADVEFRRLGRISPDGPMKWDASVLIRTQFQDE